MPTGSLLSYANAYARHGLPVVPLHNPIRADGRLRCSCGKDCSSPAKHPRLRHGLKDATTNTDLIRRWWARWPNANIGLCTGAIVAVDVDPGHDGDDSLRELEKEHGELPPTWRFLTGGGGEHILFRPPRGIEIRNSASKLGSGIDVRGAGGYLCAPPSHHISGRHYCISVDHHPQDVGLAEMPEWMVTKLTAEIGSARCKPSEEWRAIVGEQVSAGRRNDTITRLSGLLLRRRVDPYVTLELIQSFNATHCTPPLDADEVLRTVDSIAAKELKRRQRWA